MSTRKNKRIKQSKDSLDDILKRIEPYLPKTPKEEPTKERQWKMSKDIICPHLPEHNQVTSPF